MALVALASAKGSPGVTTTGLVLGALWPRQVLLAECDPAGSDVAIRMTAPGGQPLNSDRGLVSLAAAGRKGLGDEVILAHSQQLDGGLDVMLGVRCARADRWHGRALGSRSASPSTRCTVPT